MPKMGDTSTTYPQSQWPFYVRQGNCAPSQCVSRNLRSYGQLPSVRHRFAAMGILPNGPLMDTHYLNFAPRFGISYSPTPTLVIRTGYGIFYTQDIGNAYFDMARNIAGRVTYTNVNSTADIR